MGLTTADKIGIGIGAAAVVGGGAYLIFSRPGTNSLDGGAKPKADPNAKKAPTGGGNALGDVIGVVGDVAKDVQLVEKVWDEVGDLFASF